MICCRLAIKVGYLRDLHRPKKHIPRLYIDRCDIHDIDTIKAYGWLAWQKQIPNEWLQKRLTVHGHAVDGQSSLTKMYRIKRPCFVMNIKWWRNTSELVARLLPYLRVTWGRGRDAWGSRWRGRLEGRPTWARERVPGRTGPAGRADPPRTSHLRTVAGRASESRVKQSPVLRHVPVG